MADTLIITRGEQHFGGVYSRVVINIPPGDDTPVLLSGLQLVGPGDLITIDRANDVTIANCTGATKAPGYFLLAWDAVNLTVDHNLMNGTAGALISGAKGRVKSVRARYNVGVNISAATGPTDKRKASFIQLQYVHCENVEIAWNQVTNEPGKSAVEDNISLMASGGTPGHSALIHNNFVDGGFAYPTGSQYSGSGIMGFDPGGGSNVSVGGYTKVYENTVLRLENQALVAAGGHDIEVCNNRAVNDGTSTAVISVAYQTFNWAGKTPASAFRDLSFHDNFSSWRGKNGHRSDFWLDPHATTAANNTAGLSTEAAERAAWAAKLALNKIILGPRPLAQSPFDARQFSAAEPRIQLVPLPSENLGNPSAVGYTADSTWVRYDSLDFGPGVSIFKARVGCDHVGGGTIELRLDDAANAPVGALKVVPTGGWYTYVEQTCPVTTVTGVHDLYLIFRAPRSGVGNVASFSFAMASAGK